MMFTKAAECEGTGTVDFKYELPIRQNNVMLAELCGIFAFPCVENILCCSFNAAQILGFSRYKKKASNNAVLVPEMRSRPCKTLCALSTQREDENKCRHYLSENAAQRR